MQSQMAADLAPITETIEEYSHRPAALEVFKARCWARAYLVGYEMMSLHHAVDGLQESAVSSGLVSVLGQDAVQHIMCKAFSSVDGVR